ncbi:M48 family metallopeptidase [Candidatus Nitrosopumilus salaria]|nr:SprT family zinc-dependent metalloprotease [Candidatus Nitrosopumilus salaria]
MLKFGKSKIPYKIIRSKQRRKTSQIIVDESSVQVFAPMSQSDEDIQKLVESKSKWIYQKKYKLTQTKKLQDKTNLLYKGIKYPFKIIRSDEESVSFSKGVFLIKTKSFSQKKINELYQKWIKTKAQSIIEKRVKLGSKITKIPVKKIRVKDVRERWGSLSDDGSINVNLNLIKAPTEILDYVIIHELCHKKIPNHSQRYWNLLYKFVPDYETKIKWLEENEKSIL